MENRINFIITADDFGISPGVNEAILKTHKNGTLTNTSIMVNMEFLQDAIQKIKKEKNNLNIGLHINLTTGKSLTGDNKKNYLTDDNGFFKYGFIGLLFLPLFKNKKMLKEQLEIEIETQINLFIKNGIKLSHIDSHKHIHTIPWIFPIVSKLVEKYEIPRIRIINENIFKTFLIKKDISLFFSKSIIKYLILKLFYHLNKYKSDIYFFSILYSCKLSEEIIQKLLIPKKYNNMEIMVHPGVREIDEKLDKEYIEKNRLLSNYRREEYEILMNLKKLNSVFK